MLSDMSDQQVYRMYRMSREYLHELHEELAPHLRTQHPEKGIASSGHYTTTSQRMLIGLRLIFGAKYQDVEHMLKPTCCGKVYDALWRTVDAIRFAFDGRWEFPVPPPRYDESSTGYMDLQDTIKAYDQLEQYAYYREPAGLSQSPTCVLLCVCCLFAFTYTIKRVDKI